MRVVDFFNRLFGNPKEITLLTQRMDEKYYSLAIEDFAIQVAINLVAGIISKCEFRKPGECRKVLRCITPYRA